MKKLLWMAVSLSLFAACNNSTGNEKQEAPKLHTGSVAYSVDTVNMQGYLAYDENDSAKRPGVVIIPEWWGLNDYPKSRANQLAEMGYVAFVADIYGNGLVVDSPSQAAKLSGAFYANPMMAKARFDAALAKLKTYKEVDTANIAAIGYCFGGGQVINMANLGTDLKGVVCFHGSVLPGTPIDSNTIKARILVCNGADDKFIPAADYDVFKKRMDSVGAPYEIKLYPGALHAFTNPAATDAGKKFNLPIAYNAAADSASWNDMKHFFGSIFPGR